AGQVAASGLPDLVRHGPTLLAARSDWHHGNHTGAQVGGLTPDGMVAAPPAGALDPHGSIVRQLERGDEAAEPGHAPLAVPGLSVGRVDRYAAGESACLLVRPEAGTECLVGGEVLNRRRVGPDDAVEGAGHGSRAW